MGQVELARMLALAVLNDDPKDPTALAVLSAVGLATGEPHAARVVAGQSFRAATDQKSKFIAARLAARASVELGQHEIAKYWLRRAVHVAPGDEARDATIRDFLTVRSQSRLRLDFGLSVKPSDNVNQGTEDSLLTIDGIPTWFYFNPSTLALSGVETTANLGLRYRIAGTEQASTETGLRFSHRNVSLSSEAKELAPLARGSDFASTTLEAFIQHRQRISQGQTLNLGLTVGTSWLAGESYSDRTRADLALITANGADSQSRLGFSIERQWLATGSPAATAYSLDFGIQHRLRSGNMVALKVEVGRTDSDDPNQEHHRKGASLRYAFGKPIAGTRLSAALSVASRDYPVFFNGVFNDSGREDLSVSANLDLAMPNLALFGFEPVLSLEASRTQSNVSRYAGESLGLGLRIQTSF